MRIVDRITTVRFQMLIEGSVFKTLKGRGFCMKIEEVRSHDGSIAHNAVTLLHGSLCMFPVDHMVVPRPDMALVESGLGWMLTGEDHE